MQKQLRVLFSSMLVFALCVCNMINVNAEDATECVEGSKLLEEEYSEGTSEMEVQARGMYLGSGTSSISKVGTGKIVAGGRTVGQMVVDKISVTVRVERLVHGSWASYTSWSATKNNAALVSTSKTLSVPIGYYYRVYSIHKANSNISDSFTDGIHV